jgi:superfamily II DNA or RNA helicase
VDGIKQANRLIKAATSWREFARLLAKLSEREKGVAFERLTQLYLQVKPEYQTKLKGVWLLKELPTQVRKKLPRLPDTDEGIDLIAETRQGQFWAIQCKFKGDADESLTVRELSTFTNLAFNSCAGTFAQAFVAHTSSKPIRKHRLLGNTHEIGLQRWLELTGEHWRLIHAQIGNKPARPKIRKPRPHQQEAIDGAKRHYLKQRKTRGKLLMPCGTGKSLTAFWITQALKSKTTLVVVPSLSLIKQSVEDWTREFVAQQASPQPEWLCVCSDESVGSVSKDEFVEDVYELGLPVTTDPAQIQSFLKRRTSSPRIVFVTYQSSGVLAKAARAAKSGIDLAILDEAHKTVGEKGKAFSLLLDDKNLKIRRRLFMTATERVVRGANDEVFSMDSKPVFGECFYHLSFKKAIHSTPSIISDYKVVTIFVTEKEIAEAVQSRKYVSDSSKGIDAEDSRYLAAAIALRKCYREYGITHAVSFHRSIRAANEFADLQAKLSSVQQKSPAIECFHISSQKSAGERSRILSDFAESKKSLITNARCLTEGVDVPAIDCVLFADPRQSTVDIVQAVGRALRPSPGKQFGYVMLPIVVPDGLSFEEFADSTEFRAVARVITALSTQDERIAEEFRLTRKARASREKIIRFDGSVPAGMKISLEQFADSVATKIWERAGKVNWRAFQSARDFVRQQSLSSSKDWLDFIKIGKLPADIPTNPHLTYRDLGWAGMGDWLGTGAIAPQLRKFRRFKEARSFAQSLELKNGKQWRDLAKSGKLPNDIPANPDRLYRNSGWSDWGDWLGTSTIAPRLRVYRPFKKARAFARGLGVTSQSKWFLFTKSGHLPPDIPACPNQTYKGKGWVSYGDWLGTGTIAPRLRRYRTFRKARAFAHKLKLKSGKGWKEFTRSGQLPADIPANPRGVYRNDGWLSMGDWLGTGTIAPSLREFRKFEDARLFARNLGLIDGSQWRFFAKSGKLPPDIPANPNTAYKNKGWVGMGDWLGTGTVASYLRKYRDFEKAREFSRSLGLKSGSEWRNFTQSLGMPSDIPANPNSVYENSGWIGMGDWLGTGVIASQLRRFRRFEDARYYARSLKLESHAEWRKHCQLGKLPQDIPSAPNQSYKNNGWGGWGDWLGTGTVAPRLRKYLPFEEARKFSRALGLKTQKEWKIFTQSGNLPQSIPKAPQHTYAGNGWKGLRDWLGTETLKRNRSFVLPFEEAKRLVRELHLKSQTEWRAYVKENRLPEGVPSNPNRTYKGEGWISFGDWLGTGTIAPRLRTYRPFIEARKFSRQLRLSSRKEWMAFASSGRLPEDIPAKPDHVYRKRGWKGVRDWLGY